MTEGGGEGTTQAIRGSSLLLLGRVLSIGLAFFSQILIIRYLSQNGKGDYGVFAYAMALAVPLKTFSLFGMPDALARYLSIYREEGRYRTALGAIVLGLGFVTSAGLLLAFGLAGVAWRFGAEMMSGPHATTLIIVLAFLVPVESLDDMLTVLFANFSSPRSIFIRRYLMAPGLRLALIVALILLDAGVVALAVGYVSVSAFGSLVYLAMFVGLVRKQAWLPSFSFGELDYPVREIFLFALPLLGNAVVWAVLSWADTWLLGYFGTDEQVADFRAVMPFARFNQLVFTNFVVLYMPLASRAFARKDYGQLSAGYWRIALWVAVVTFPILALTVCFPRPIIETAIGSQYGDASLILLLLSVGFYVNAVLGLTGGTLSIFHKLRFLLVVDVLTAIGNVALNIALIPRYGAEGAAVATMTSLIVHGVVRQIGLWKITPVSIVPSAWARVMVGMALALAVLLAVDAWLEPGVLLAIFATGLASLFVVWVSRQLLDIGGMFPELLRVPVARRLLRPFLVDPAPVTAAERE